MKRNQAPLVVAIVVSVFLLSFLIGRATALRERQDMKRNEIYTAKPFTPKKEEVALPTGAVSEKIEELEIVSQKESTKKETPEKKKESTPTPPERMLFPAGEDVLKGYSQTAVYSETMKDWRAHMGIDYQAKKGEEVKSVWDGTVKKVYKDSLWGYCVEIIHNGEITSVYRNLAENTLVKEGDKLQKGQAVGFVGDTAVVEKSEKDHLHFELWVNGVAINPESYVY